MITKLPWIDKENTDDKILEFPETHFQNPEKSDRDPKLAGLIEVFAQMRDKMPQREFDEHLMKEKFRKKAREQGIPEEDALAQLEDILDHRHGWEKYREKQIARDREAGKLNGYQGDVPTEDPDAPVNMKGFRHKGEWRANHGFREAHQPYDEVLDGNSDYYKKFMKEHGDEEDDLPFSRDDESTWFQKPKPGRIKAREEYKKHYNEHANARKRIPRPTYKDNVFESGIAPPNNDYSKQMAEMLYFPGGKHDKTD